VQPMLRQLRDAWFHMLNGVAPLNPVALPAVSQFAPA
jgi:hypothetical protein